ncbi:6-phospho-3-hexuloisomerase [Methanothermobacter sp. KEPCO-1]|uniref:6-phospho-3-hexuloisomerase n=1 Tax=Methanothermobacter TaxID=145260 RepID=UPI0011C73657|nr:6-phospho-3-hexuloisomerase [Methanothermobacter sp. KEPCO-1]QEF95328.1 6-phospho-3-hexuloisomerase [Methanothermobacter sp. KEPCO-1]
MEILKNTVHKITEHAINAIEKVEESELEQMITRIMDARAVFIVGTGRSELVGKAFAMRLMHLGFTVYVVGDVTTPAISDEDCLIAISGSGETKTVTLAATTSKSVGATVIAVTATPQSTLTEHSDVVIWIPSKTKEAWKYYTSGVLRGDYDDLTPMGTLFEDSTHLFLDGLIAEFMAILGKKERDLKERHAIIE